MGSRPAPEQALAEACTAAGLDPQGATIIYARSNTVYRLAACAVVVRLRYAPGPGEQASRVAASVRVTAWLDSLDFPAVRPLDIPQPVTARGYIVTFWHLLPSPAAGQPPPDVSTLAHPLRQLHNLPAPPAGLPAARPLGSAREDTQGCAWLTAAQRSWLLARFDELEHQYADATWSLGSGLIHGDAWTDNLIGTRDGAVLADWDAVSHGPRELDLVPTSIRYRFGQPSSDWQRFCRAYGTDPAGLPGLPVLQAMRELRTIAAYLRAPDYVPARAEATRRISDLMSGTQDQPWHALNLAI
jgi:aminoglycoside phosphotransferase (APT) family kinase protein